MPAKDTTLMRRSLLIGLEIAELADNAMDLKSMVKNSKDLNTSAEVDYVVYKVLPEILESMELSSSLCVLGFTY